MILVEPLGVLEEEAAGIQAGDAVDLRGGDELPALAQLDDAVDAGEDDLRHVKGLGDEVGGAELQRLQLRALFRGQDDDGDAPEHLVDAHRLQHLDAAHDGHHQIEQDQREIRCVLAHQVHALLPVFRIDDLIVVFQNDAQHLPVDHLIVDDQHKLSALDLFGTDHTVSPPSAFSLRAIRRRRVL